MDADLALLAGDALYALGLDGWPSAATWAVAELCDLISLRQAQAEGRGDERRRSGDSVRSGSWTGVAPSRLHPRWWCGANRAARHHVGTSLREASESV